jgi:hypothetical protein
VTQSANDYTDNKATGCKKGRQRIYRVGQNNSVVQNNTGWGKIIQGGAK